MRINGGLVKLDICKHYQKGGNREGMMRELTQSLGSCSVGNHMLLITQFSVVELFLTALCNC